MIQYGSTALDNKSHFTQKTNVQDNTTGETPLSTPQSSSSRASRPTRTTFISATSKLSNDLFHPSKCENWWHPSGMGKSLLQSHSGLRPWNLLHLRNHHFQNVSTVDSNINLPLPWHQKIITLFYLWRIFFLKREPCPFKLMMCRWHLRAKMCFKGIKEGEHVVWVSFHCNK